MKKSNRIYHCIYVGMILLFVLAIVYLISTDNTASWTSVFSRDSVAFDEGWYCEDGEAADMSHLNQLTEPYVETSVYHILPSEIDSDCYLCFRSKNIYYQVYVGDELRYDPEVPESELYNLSFGTRWNYVALESTDVGKTAEIRFYTVYEESRACVDNLTLGPAAGSILSMLQSKSFSFITCLLLLFIGVLLIVADIPINIRKEKNHELLYLGLFATSIAVWCFAETNIMQLFTNDSRMLQLVSCSSLMMIPIPIVLYLDAAFELHRHFLVPVICFASGAEFVICTILHLTKILDFHETLTLTHILLLTLTVIMISVIFWNVFLKAKSHSVFQFLRTIGFSGICFATVIDIIRYYRGSGSDSAMFVRVGLLIFVICYGSSSLEKTINAVKLGVQSELISQLAYRDGLTAIGNRTAFQEQLESLEGTKESLECIAIIMFDVNDLKYVNDNLGHQVGDKMLVASANIIKESFSALNASCYRIGGDEFAVILSGEHTRERCKEGLAQFKKNEKAFNENDTEKLFHVSIASGYAFYEKTDNNSKLDDIYREADAKMYQNKKEIKAARAASPAFSM